ncbi:branched-chain amino acid ABC transporter permease [Demequina sediminicola]|uniref:branched-chain amino acid ABC transporter permease n=1 Tax=Demequina sediminicola TaxID=1095026 RepID=UPI000785F5CD|nr:branched-chain amino acid ABC transporter permease [Demequina sediminicola]
MDIVLDALGTMMAPATAAFALAAIGLNFHFGLTGLLNMGHAGFMLLGMYGYGISTQHGAPIWMALIIAIIAATIFGLLLGWPTLKLRGDYLAIATISAAELVRYLGRSNTLQGLTGGSTGIRGNDFKFTFEELSPLPDENITILFWTNHGTKSSSWWLMIVAWVFVALFALLFWQLARSPWGRVLKGIREDEDAVRSLGKNVYSYKMQALVLGGVIGALGGVIWALGASVQPDSMGRPTTFWLWTILLLGGAATVFGPILGSMIFWMSLVIIKGLASAFIPSSVLSPVEIEPFSLVLVGIALMCLVIFRPQGILGNKRELAFND